MKTISISRTVIVGFFILVGLAILVAGVFTIGVQQKTFQKTVTLRVIFDDVQGLQPGNNVWLSGVKIGTVKKTQFHGNSQVEVTMAVERDAEVHIRKDSRAKVGSDGFIGNRIIVIYGGSSSAAFVSDGDYLMSESGISTDDVLATLQENNRNLLEITGNVKKISERILNGQGTLGTLINDPTLANSLQSILHHVRSASAKTESTVSRIEDFLTGLDRDGGLAHELVYDTLVFSNVKQTTTRLKAIADTLSVFSDQVKKASAALGRNDNPAGTILTDQQMAADLKKITRNLETSSEKLDEDLRALQHNFLLKGYFKNLEKEKKKHSVQAPDSVAH